MQAGRAILTILLVLGTSPLSCNLNDSPFFQGTGSLTGRVLSPEGAPVANALVHFHRDAGILEPAQTGEYGTFETEGIPVGVQPLVIRAPTLSKGARLEARIVEGAVSDLGDIWLGDAVDTTIVAMDFEQSIWDAVVTFDEVWGLEDSDPGHTEFKATAIPLQGQYHLTVSRDPFLFAYSSTEIAAKDIPPRLLVRPEPKGSQYEHAQFYCGFLELVELQRQESTCDTSCSWPYTQSDQEGNIAVPPCAWPVGDSTPDQGWYASVRRVSEYLNDDARLFGDYLQSMVHCPAPNEVDLACHAGHCRPALPAGVSITLLDRGEFLPDLDDYEPRAMTNEQVGLKMPDSVDIGTPEWHPDSLYTFFTRPQLRLPPELITITRPDIVAGEGDLNLYYRGTITETGLSDLGSFDSRNRGWSLYRIDFPAGTRPTPSEVILRLAWYITDVNPTP